MKKINVNISFKKSFLEKIDEVARKESRPRSELIRQATKQYVDNKELKDKAIEKMKSESLNCKVPNV